MKEARIIVKRSQVTDRLFGKIRALGNIQGFANRVLYQEYRRLQIERWETENVSQGERWKKLNPGYRKSKLLVYKDFPYGGRRVGVATGRLIKSSVGPSPEHRKLPTSRGFRVFTAVPYAGEFDEKRTITTFSKETRESIAAKIREYLSA